MQTATTYIIMFSTNLKSISIIFSNNLLCKTLLPCSEFTLYQSTKSKLKLFADVYLSLTPKRELLSLVGLKTLWEKEKMLATSIFSFSQNVFESFLSLGS